MKVNFKLQEGATMPAYGRPGDSGLDLVATKVEFTDYDGIMTCYTGVHVEIPEGYTGFLFARSSVANKDYNLANAVGVIDSNYRGELIFKFRTTTVVTKDFRNVTHNYTHKSASGYEVGNKVGQLVIVQTPTIDVTVVDELSSTNRGTDGFGSSGS